MRDPECVFCARVAAHMYDHSDAANCAFEPLNPVVPGHMLVVPFRHVSSAQSAPAVAGRAMMYAGYLSNQLGYGAANFITSSGRDATQTVFHLHIHVIPRLPGDGVILPWTSQQAGTV